MSHAEKAEGLATSIDKETDGYIFNHSMLRIKDPKRSLEFYSKVLGMRLVKKLDFPSMKFSLYFLGKHTDEEVKQIPTDSYERTVWTFRQKGLLELTHNWGAENDDAVKFFKKEMDNELTETWRFYKPYESYLACCLKLNQYYTQNE